MWFPVSFDGVCFVKESFVAERKLFEIRRFGGAGG